MGRFQRSIELFKASWAVLREDRELLILPVISGVVWILTLALFAVPVLATIDLDAVASDGSDTVTVSPVTFVLLAMAYVALAFVGIFFNSALVHAANERMNGGDPTVGSALRGASSRVNRILPWAIVTATVSFIIRQIQERAGLLGRLLGFMAGMAWAAVTFLVLPILVIEDIAVVDAVKRSTGLVRKAWGEGIAGHLGMGLLGIVAMIPFVLVGVLGAMSGTAVLAIPAVFVAVFGTVAVTVVITALSAIYKTALYRYAVAEPVTGFQPELMRGAFTRKG